MTAGLPPLDPALFRAAGEAFSGHAWQKPLARALGPFFPAGPRDHIDDRLVRRWADGERPVPGWVAGALRELLERRRAALAAVIEALPESP